MLYSFKRYTQSGPYPKLILYKNKSTICSRMITYSIFFRKMHFRSLLLYTNFMYSNFLNPLSLNFFYIHSYINNCSHINHNSFFFKKIQLK